MTTKNNIESNDDVESSKQSNLSPFQVELLKVLNRLNESIKNQNIILCSGFDGLENQAKKTNYFLDNLAGSIELQVEALDSISESQKFHILNA